MEQLPRDDNGARGDVVSDSERTMSRRSFLWAGGALLAGYGSLRWLAGRPAEEGLPWPMRRALEVNEGIGRRLFREQGLAATFPTSEAGMPRTNGLEGMTGEIGDWSLRVETPDGRRVLTMEDILRLPRHEQVTELKCIEGWSKIVRWGGARFSDFAERYGGGQRPTEYVYMETPDGGYFVGLDIESAVHPQTLLCYEMDGLALEPRHGAPLRLVIPTKYGIKNIKRIGVIRFTSSRPSDYWAKEGYDWYAGL